MMAKRAKNPVQSWPASSVEMWPLDKIIPYEGNPRTHPSDQVEALARDMLEDGVTMPILIDEDGVILAGHGRRLGALANGFTEYPVVIARGWSKERKRAVRIKDNQRALQSGWDNGLIQAEITSLKTGGYDIQLLGFPEATLRGWGIGAGATTAADPEAIPEAPKKPIVRVGDIWTLGKHRLACGDSTSSEVWKALFGRERASMVFTDPPYGVSYQAPSGAFGIIEGDKKRRDDLYKMLVNSLREMVRYATDAAAFYIWHASSTREDFAQAMKAVGLAERQYLMWVKPAIVFGHADYQWQHEPAFYAAKADKAPAFYGARAESTVWHVQLATAKDTAATIGNGMLLLDGQGGSLYVQSRAPKNKKLRQIRLQDGGNVYLSGADRQDGTVWEVARDPGHEHPTQKPVELARRAIENSSKPGEIVADGFLGSSTSLIGAELTGRRCFGIELDPVYAEVGIRRWERFTGQAAMLGEQTFEQVAKNRGGKNAAGHSRKPVPGKDAGGDRGEQAVRPALHARRAPPRRKPAGIAPPLARDP